ncbi:MAG: amidohydrolase [Trueperaceae bacterium]|nr:amidohydrolase [Trueperaceae bacterium]
MTVLSEKRDLYLSEFKPKAQVVVKETLVETPRFPVIDAHIHLSSGFGGKWRDKPLEDLLEAMDRSKISKVIDLDGGWGEDILDANLAYFKEKAPERFVHFAGVDWEKWAELGNAFPEYAVKRLRAQASRGAEGLKIWKPFGLQVKDQEGKLVAVDDERLIPLWETAGELNLPVLVHVADPVAFFDPLNEHNERWEELHKQPDWQFTSPPYPSFSSILEAFANLIRRHKNTVFIGAHVGCYAENLGWVSALLDECPNFYIDISARLGELGRQPYSSRRFFIKHAERILFGTDADARQKTYQLYYRFLETDDEYFSYNLADPPRQGRWYVYGLYLPDEVLEKVYYQNAVRLLGKGT